MTHALRAAALLMAVAAVIDPGFAGRRRAPLAIDVYLPRPDDARFAEATRVRDSILQALGEAVHVNGAEPPRAVVAVGNADIDAVPRAPVFAVRIGDGPAVTATRAAAVHTLWGQRPAVSATFRGRGVKDRTTTFTLAGPGGLTLGSIEHRWTKEDEAFEPSFAFAPAASGLALLRITAASEGLPPVAVDIPVATSERRARVFVFEPRPSWAVGFARLAIESDPLFEVRALARTSRGIVTRSTGAPASLAALDPESTDAIVVGGLEALTDPDLMALRRFAEERGGSVVLVPDARLPERVRRAFDLPSMEEALVERPTELRQGETRVRATELLRLAPRGESPAGDALWVAPRGRGQVLVALALDAWRYRGDRDSGFPDFWRAVAADAATAAAPAVSVAVDPVVARPGDEVTLRAHLRLPSARTGGALRLPGASASLVGVSGDSQPVRLWPGASAGEYVARTAAPASGRYNVRVDLEGLPRQDAVLLVDAAVARPSRDRAAEMAFLAETTGGALFPSGDLSRLVATVRALPVAEHTRQLRPTRSAWWMLAFASLLCAEWALRRTRGLR